MSQTSDPIVAFMARWKASEASERANYRLFLTELCDLLGVEKPRPASDKVHEADYTFKRPVSAKDPARHFKQVPKGQMTQRVQQIESLLETQQALGLLRKTEGGMYVK